MSALPKVFISATSGDLRSIRQIVKEALLTINCHPVEQTNFEPDWRTVEGMLRGKIEGCQALIHIAGMRYGAEPAPATLPPGTVRRSYTQMEYAIGCQLHEQRGDAGFRVYTFLCPEDFPFDACEAEPEEKAALQRAHRAALIDNPRLYEQPGSAEALKGRILALQEQVLSLQQQETEVRTEVRDVRRSILGGLAAFHHEARQGFSDIRADLKLDSARIKTHMRESSERRLEQDLQAADLEAKSEARERLKENAQAAHQSRLARIEHLATSFALIEGRTDATEEVKEMGRILQEEGVDDALRYIEGKRAALLARVAAADAAHVEQRRAQLQPLLQAASLLATQGKTAAARASYQDLLKLDPAWPEALEDYAWFLHEQTRYFNTTGPLTAAIADAQQCLAHAQRLQALDSSQPRAKRLLSAAHDQMGDVLGKRRAKGDADEILRHCQQSLSLAEVLYQANPESAQAARDVSVSLNKLGDFLAKRGQPGDAEAARKHYTRSLEQREKLLAANPDSDQAVRDFIIALDHMAQMANDNGESDKALKYLIEGNATMEKLLAANPDSAQAARDMSVSLNKLGDFLAKRGQPGDAEAARKHYTRSLEHAEKLLTANPDSCEAARDYIIALDHVAQMANDNGESDEVLKYLIKANTKMEELLAANPDSAEAARDVSVSLNKLGDFLAKRGQPGDVKAALKHYARDLEMSEKLLAANPDSAQAARDVVVSQSKLAAYCQQQGDQAGVMKHFRACYDLLRSRIAKGMTFDPPVLKLHEELQGMFGEGR